MQCKAVVKKRKLDGKQKDESHTCERNMADFHAIPDMFAYMRQEKKFGILCTHRPTHTLAACVYMKSMLGSFRSRKIISLDQCHHRCDIHIIHLFARSKSAQKMSFHATQAKFSTYTHIQFGDPLE